MSGNSDNYNINSTLLIYSENGKSNSILEVGQTIPPGASNPSIRNGQTLLNQALLNEVGNLKYDFLNYQTNQNQNLVGYIIEADIDYSFYNVVKGVNNELYVSLGPLDDNNLPISPPYLEVLPLPPGNYSPSEFAQGLTIGFNEFYKQATGGVEEPYLIEYNQSTRRFTFIQNATVLGLNTYIYSVFPISLGFRPEINDLNELSLAWKLLGLTKNTGQTVKNFYGAGDNSYIISYWIIPSEGTLNSTQVIDLRFTTNIQISTTYDANSRNSNSRNKEATNLITNIPIPPLYLQDERPPSSLSFVPNDYLYRNTFLINSSNINNLQIFLTDVRGNLLEMNGGTYSIRIKLEPIPLLNPSNQPDPYDMMTFLKDIGRYNKKDKKNITLSKIQKKKIKFKINSFNIKKKFLE